MIEHSVKAFMADGSEIKSSIMRMVADSHLGRLHAPSEDRKMDTANLLHHGADLDGRKPYILLISANRCAAIKDSPALVSLWLKSPK